ncbi:MAG: hypothetical protein U9P10_08110 [Thermodesulfobacteriota bacterium]|nr:hypothetical protein [Thermodesulfobacteriota bacterium]
MEKVRSIIAVIMLVTIIIAVFFVFRISSSITTPLKQLMDYFENSSLSGSFAGGPAMAGKDEIGMLGRYFSAFMDKLDRERFKLNQEIKERREVEKALKKSEDGYREAQELGDKVRRRIGQDLHDDLCPHLIGIHGLCSVLRKNLVKKDM